MIVLYTKQKGKTMTEKDYIVCFLCGLNRVFRSNKRAEKGRPTEYNFPTIDLKDAFFVQVREGGGKVPGSGIGKGRGKAKGIGFHLIPSASLTLSEAMQDSDYTEVIAGMKQQLIKLFNDAKEIGLINEGDL